MMPSEQLPSTRKDAIRSNSTFYFTGRECSKGHLSKRRTSTKKCVACEKHNSQAYRDRHPGFFKRYERERNRSRSKTEEYRSYHRDYGRKWREQNPEKARAQARFYARKNQKQRTEYLRLWRDKNRGRLVEYRLSREMRVPEWADRRKIELMYWAAKEIQNETGEEIHVDHIIPLQGVSVSGLHVHENLQLLPRYSNLEKSNFYDETNVVDPKTGKRATDGLEAV